MTSNRDRVLDPRLGEGVVLKGSRRATLALGVIALGILLCLGGIELADPNAGYQNSPAFLFLASGFGLVALSQSRWRLVIGAEGFRLEKALRPLLKDSEVSWSEVSGCEVASYHSPRLAFQYLSVELRNGRVLNIGLGLAQGLTESWWDVCDLMEERRAAYREAHAEVG
jgi:hypothetical protein